MEKDLILAGKIVNTHGLTGEVRITPWCDSPEFLCQFKSLYIGGVEYKVDSCKPHKSLAIFSLSRVNDINAAMKLLNLEVFIDASSVALEPGSVFIRDLIGLSAINADSGLEFGRVVDVLPLPAHDVYEIKGEKSYLIPAVSQFVKEVNVSEGYIKFNLIEGLEQ